jgi:recombination protein RecA
MRKELEAAISAVQKLYGKGAVISLGSPTAFEVEVVSTGTTEIDKILGIGGIPRGRVTEIYGPESSGKTTLALQIIAQAQKLGGQAVYIDAEHALDPTYAKALGVNIDEVLISQPGSGEEALEIAETFIRSNGVAIVVVDSVAALVPKAELEGEMGDPQMGLMARLMSQALRKLVAAVSRTGTVLIFLNQVRDKIGVMFGNPETTTGGRALKFYASIRIEVRRMGDIKKSDDKIGAKTKITVKKNKFAPPFKVAEVPLMFGQGFVNEDSK